MTNPTNKVTGNIFQQIQPCRIGTNESGWFTDLPIETTDYDIAASIALSYDVGGILYDWDQTFGKHRVTAHYPYKFTNDPATEPPIILWEINNQRVEKSILDSQNVLANAVTQGALYYLNLFQQNPSNYIITISNTFGNPPVLVDPSQYPLAGTPMFSDTNLPANTPYIQPPLILGFPSTDPAADICNLLVNGVTSFPVFAPQLKLTRSINPLFPDRIPYVNVGSIVSTATMYDLYNIPANTLFSLPNLIDPAPADGKPVLHYGWFVNSPQCNQIARLKFQIVQSWDYGLWPELVYGIPL